MSRKIALVTGAGRGIGKGIDDVLSEMQAYVQSGFAQLAEPRTGSGAETEADASSNTGSNDPGNHRQYGGVQPARGE